MTEIITYKGSDSYFTVTEGANSYRVLGGTKGANFQPTSPVAVSARRAICEEILTAEIASAGAHEFITKTYVLSIVAVESSYNPRAASHSPAMGISQFVGPTAQSMGILDYWNYADELKGCVKYCDLCLRNSLHLRDRNKVIIYGAMRYNRGHGATDTDCLTAAETNEYGKKFVNFYNRLRTTYNPSIPELVYTV